MYKIHLIGQASIATRETCPPALSNLFYIEQASNKEHTPQLGLYLQVTQNLFHCWHYLMEDGLNQHCSKYDLLSVEVASREQFHFLFDQRLHW